MREMMYKGDFVVWSLVIIGWFIFNMVFYHLLFEQIDSVAGWSKGQMFVLQGCYFLFEFLIWGIFYANFNQLPWKINRGQIDFALTKPVNPQFLLSFPSIHTNQITNLILGVITITYGLNLAGITPSLHHILLALIIIFISGIFIYSAYFITICLAFFTERLNNIAHLFPSLRDLSKVPQPAYTGWAKIAFTYAIPIVLATTLPSQALFGRPDYFLILVLLVIALISLYLSTLFFNFSLKRYSSASS